MGVRGDTGEKLEFGACATHGLLLMRAPEAADCEVIVGIGRGCLVSWGKLSYRGPPSKDVEGVELERFCSFGIVTGLGGREGVLVKLRWDFTRGKPRIKLRVSSLES